MIEINFTEICHLESASAAILQIYKETDFFVTSFEELPTKKEDICNSIKKEITSKHDVSICALSNGKVVGLLRFRRYKLKRLYHSGEFSVFVLKKYNGRNLATRMIELLFEWCRQNSVTKIDLSVMEQNTRALKLYKHLGFEVEGIRKRAVYMNNNYYSLIEMGKAL